MDDPVYKVNVAIRKTDYVLKRAPNGQAIYILSKDGTFIRKAGSLKEATEIVNDLTDKYHDPEAWKTKYSRIGLSHRKPRNK